MGAGAVGGYFGARLASAGLGLDVCFVARGENLAALRQRGLRVHTPSGDIVLPEVWATSDPAEAYPADLILVAVKAYDTQAVAEAMRPAVNRETTTVLSLQNGVENEEILARVLGLPPLLLALTQIGSELIGPGEVRYFARGTIVFGEAGGEESQRVRDLAALFVRADVPHHVSRNIRVRLWDKLAWNASFNAVTTLTGQTVAEAIDDADTRQVIADTMAEVARVAAAQGIPCDPSRIPGVLTESRSGLGAFKTSMLQDRERGRRLEYDAINGAILRAADRVGAEAPLNRLLCTLLRRLDRDRR
jgi:2-dehydropantoate 2-reductase